MQFIALIHRQLRHEMLGALKVILGWEWGKDVSCGSNMSFKSTHAIAQIITFIP